MRSPAEKSAKLILASASPRRRELMSLLGCPFETEAALLDETVPYSVSISDTAEYLAFLKAESVYAAQTAAGRDSVTVIGSDTVVVLDGVIYGKPRDEEDAFRMLRNLSGRTHEVRTGVAIISGRQKRAGDISEETPMAAPFRMGFTSSALVTFFDLSDEEIYEYIATGEPMDKAGAYGAQGRGALLVSRIEGDFFTVMGFPVAMVYRALRDSGVIQGFPGMCASEPGFS